MQYMEQWSALAARIRGLAKAAELHARFSGIKSSDPFNRGERLGAHCQRLVAGLKDFRATFGSVLPKAACACLDEFMADTGNLIEAASGTALEAHKLWSGLVLLTALETELSHLLSDTQFAIRSRAELAFAHLQRLIVVDGDLRTKWQAAFDDTAGEVRCEQLGAVHLLWHGIWAFKVDAAGARTDLVYQNADDHPRDQPSSGLVLTEWKKANAATATKRYEEARNQATLYKQGALAGIELAGYRYAIVVSRAEVDVPDDMTLNGVVFRHVNIAVAPTAPSKRARAGKPQ